MKVLDFEMFVFDLDGVILDSEKVHFECYKNSIKSEILTYDTYCKVKHSINDLKFHGDPIINEEICTFKQNMYVDCICKLCLVNGVELFIKLLLSLNKIICIVTDSSLKIVELILNKFKFLKNVNRIITRDDVKTRKPSSECYLKVLKEFKHIENYKIIGFEDSYKGWTSMTNVLYNTVLVNNNEYYYYDQIVDGGQIHIINDFENITDLQIYSKNFSYYISSKTKHAEKWKDNKIINNFNVVSTWFKHNTKKELMDIYTKSNICYKILEEIKNCDYMIFYIEENDTNHIGSFVEFGIALALNKQIFIIGHPHYKHEVILQFSNINTTYENCFEVDKILFEIDVVNSFKYRSIK